MSKRRVVITGVGPVTPIGIGKETFWSNLVAGKSGVGPITQFDTEGFTVKIAAEVKDFDYTAYIDKKEGKRMDRVTQLAVAAAKLAAGYEQGKCYALWRMRWQRHWRHPHLLGPILEVWR